MKKFMIIAAAVCMAASAACAENVSLRFDDREWVQGYAAQNEQTGIVEYVLKGETVEAWTELVTVQAFFGLQARTDAEAYMRNMLAGIREVCPGVVTSIIKTGGSDCVFDWEIASCPGQADQYEIDRVIVGAEALYVLHYATKKVPVPAPTREAWARLLSESALVK